MGEEVTLSIEGYDPRDLLSGHYLTYRVIYGVNDVCNDNKYRSKKEGFICLDSKKFSYNRPYNCNLFIKGICKYKRFIAGIERFYIPQSAAVKLDRLVRDNKGKIVVSITKSGVAQVKKLLINDQAWENL